MMIESEYDLGEFVYLKTDNDQFLRIVTAIFIRHGNSVAYELSCGTASSNHFGIEISREKDFAHV